MREPIESEYFNWLCAKVRKSPPPMYDDLFSILYQTEFVWVIPNDRNRAEDGKELRIDFLRELQWENDPGWFNEPCSVLEMLIAFAKRAYFQTDRQTKDWFWEFIANLMLDDFRHVSQDQLSVIEEILHTFVWRTYEPSGHGGIFPMRWPKHDQRRIEIWYQFNEYLEDQGLM